MIIVNLKGGLGNQMFQLAAGIALAERTHAELKLDLSFLENSRGSAEFTQRKLELDIFDSSYKTASKEEIAAFKGNEQKLWYRVMRKFSPGLIRKKIFRHDALNYDSRFEQLGKEAYLDGYFQSEKYFVNAPDLARKSFRFKNSPSGKNKDAADKISSVNSVSLHVRRGDYLSEVNKKIFGNICTPEYYSKAIRYIKAHVNDPQFFVFSDDPVWVKDNLKIDAPVNYIDFNTGDNSYEDMRLMSLCRHQVIANSSFSWWGAWLNNHPGKIVLAPDKWINDPGCVVGDVIPENWIRIA
jgi:hypothetical protein